MDKPINTQKKVPAIRFQGFSGEWEEKTLGEVANYRNGKAHERHIVEKGKYTVVNSKFISTSGSVKKFSNLQIEPLFKDEVTFVLSDVPNGRAIARTFLVKRNNIYTLNQRIAGIKPVENTCPYYLSILLNRNSYFLRFDDGVSQTNLSKNDVLSFSSFYPESKEQTQIGDFFQALDDLIAKREQKHAKLRKIKQALLGKLFPQAGETVPQMRFVGFSGDWEEVTIENICTLLKGKTLSWNDIEVNGKHECILYGNLYTDYGMVIKKINHSTNQNAPNIPRSCVGDVLIPASDTTPTGIARASSLEKKDVLLGGDINILRPIEGVSGSFLSYNINSNRIKLIRLIKGTSVKHLSNSDIKNVELFIAKDKKEQTQIGNLFQRLDTLIDQYEQQITTLKNIKQGYLNKMFI